MAAMTEATVQQSATTTREQIWLNREQVRKEKPVYRALKRAQDIFFSLLALIVLSPLMLNDVTFDEWMDMDMRYIRDRTFLLDWKLIFGTVWTVFAGTGE